MLRILAERNRPHGQMLGEEAQEALQGKRQGPHPCRRTLGAQLFLLTAPLSLPRPGEHLPCPCNILLFLRFPPQLPQHLEKSAYPGLHQVSLGVGAKGQAGS